MSYQGSGFTPTAGAPYATDTDFTGVVYGTAVGSLTLSGLSGSTVAGVAVLQATPATPTTDGYASSVLADSSVLSSTSGPCTLAGIAGTVQAGHTPDWGKGAGF